MDTDQNKEQGYGQNPGFSDTILFDPVGGAATTPETDKEPTVEEILNEFLEKNEDPFSTEGTYPAEQNAPQSENSQQDFFAAAPAQKQSPAQEQPPAQDAGLTSPQRQTPVAQGKPSGAQGQAPTHDSEDEEPTVVEQPERKRLTGWAVVWAISKYVWKIGLGIVLAIGILVIGLIGYLSVTEYNPSYAENADRGSVNRSEAIAKPGLSIMTFNTGYGGLGAEADFFMDGGEGVLPESEEVVESNMVGIESILSLTGADFILLQEVDTDSARSFGTNQWIRYEYGLKNYESRFAMNYSCDYVPYPYKEPMGRVRSGIATYSSYDVVSATRFSLANGNPWPNRVANLKRCMLVTRIPIENTERQLVLINVHMEAYDDSEVRDEQIRQLVDFAQEEYRKGNFVIAGGDFNSTFPGSNRYEVRDPELWTPGKLSSVGNGYRYIYDDDTPTCRLLNQPYEAGAEGTQYYVIDGFLVSPNVIVDKVETLDYDFIYSDHNPVLMNFTLNLHE